MKATKESQFDYFSYKDMGRQMQLYTGNAYSSNGLEQTRAGERPRIVVLKWLKDRVQFEIAPTREIMTLPTGEFEKYAKKNMDTDRRAGATLTFEEWLAESKKQDADNPELDLELDKHDNVLSYKRLKLELGSEVQTNGASRDEKPETDAKNNKAGK